MHATTDTTRLDDMTSAPSATIQEPRSTSTYAASRSAQTRPSLSVAAFRDARRARAVQLSWVGLVRSARR